MENLAAVLHGPCDLRVEPWPVEEPKQGEIQVRVHSVGVCGTDVLYWKKGVLFDQPLTSPMVLGHETAAEVIKLGAGVDNFKIGDRVHLIPASACHTCECCLQGKEYNCQRIKLGNMGHGHLRRICNHPAANSMLIPDNLSMDEGALMEPWAVAVYAVEKGSVIPGQKCTIIGAGSIGVMVFLAAKLSGAVDICIVDTNQDKLDLVSKAGECKTVLATRDPRETAGLIEQALGGKPDVGFDATCTSPGITTAIYATKPCGKVVMAGLAPEPCTLPMMHASINEIDILTIVRFGHCYPRATEMLKSGKVKLSSLVAARFPLDKTNDALKSTATGLTAGFKNIIDCTL